MKLALALALAGAAACRSEPRAHAPGPSPTTATTTTTTTAHDAPPAPDAAAPAEDGAIPPSTTQLVTAIVADWTATAAELQLWQRDGAAWTPVGAPWPAVIGRTGAAWGAGLHGDAAPAGRAGPVKREGDGKSPAGVFLVRGTFGFAARAAGTMPYTQLVEGSRCVDDPRSRHYTRIVDAGAVANDWTSAEDMRGMGALYRWGVDLAHNPAPVPGGGSCIFLHVWSDAAGATAGCTAMPEDKLVALLGRLDPARAPAFVLLPRAEYDALAAPWGLPD